MLKLKNKTIFRLFFLIGTIFVNNAISDELPPCDPNTDRGCKTGMGDWIVSPTPRPIKPGDTAFIGGPNRRVTAPSGYGKISGIFQRLGGMEPKRSKPTFYFGAKIESQHITVDTGVQYEPLVVGRTPPGWSIFYSATAGGRSLQFNPKKSNGQGYRVTDEYENGNSIEASFWVGSNAVTYLHIKGFPDLTVDLTPHGGNIDTSAMKLRRVVGITQVQGFSMDGSYFLGTLFRNGELCYWGDNSSGYKALMPPQSWPIGDSTRRSIAEIVPPSVASQRNGEGKWVVDMNAPWKRNPSGSGQEPDPASYSPSKFEREVVNIDLRTRADFQRERLKHGSRR